MLQCISFPFKFSNIRILCTKWGGWQLDLHWQSPSQVNCDSRERERNEKTEQKPVSLSDSEVKWMCNLLSRETHCKQKSCVMYRGSELLYVKMTAWLCTIENTAQIYCQTVTELTCCTNRDHFLTTVIATTVEHLQVACVLIY